MGCCLSLVWPDSHVVQSITLEVPAFNVPVFKWPKPQALHVFDCNRQGLEESAVALSGLLKKQVLDALQSQDTTAALRLWSSACEKAIAQNSTTNEGETLSGKRYLGRASNVSPVKRVLAAPRSKAGRKSDFMVATPYTSASEATECTSVWTPAFWKGPWSLECYFAFFCFVIGFFCWRLARCWRFDFAQG